MYALIQHLFTETEISAAKLYREIRLSANPQRRFEPKHIVKGNPLSISSKEPETPSQRYTYSSLRIFFFAKYDRMNRVHAITLLAACSLCSSFVPLVVFLPA